MKTIRYEFQWFEKEDRRKRLRASVSRDGKLRLGKGLRQLLPSSIRVGFDSRIKVLAIADGRGEGMNCPACGIVTAQALSAQITSTGLHLPVSFVLLRDEGTGFFLGKIVPRRCLGKESGERRYDAEQLLVLYRHLVDDAVGRLARSTPSAERRAAAEEELCAAVGEYQPGYGDLEAYLEKRITHRLLEENRPYAREYTRRSLDAPFTGEGDGFCLYDTAETATRGGIDVLEEQIDLERFCARLTEEERVLLRRLQEGWSIQEIMEELGLDRREFWAMARRVESAGRAFWAE